MNSEETLQKIADILFPPDNPTASWSADTIDEIGAIVLEWREATGSTLREYDKKQIADEIRITASGRAYYGNALLVALEIPCIKAAVSQRSAIERYLRGNPTATDHIRLQEAALLIDPPTQPTNQPTKETE